ncbi:hypothetical protein MRX96_049465 [Rhipicephalus microplus]
MSHNDPELTVRVPTTDGGSQLCNYGSTRFGSWEHCRKSCLEPDHVSERRLEDTLCVYLAPGRTSRRHCGISTASSEQYGTFHGAIVHQATASPTRPFVNAPGIAKGSTERTGLTQHTAQFLSPAHAANNT